MTNRLSLFLLIVLGLTMLVLVGVQGLTKNAPFKKTRTQEQVQRVQQQNTPTPAPKKTIGVHFVTANTYWQVGKSQKVSVVFDTASIPPPVAFDVYVRFDPAAVQVTDIVYGNLWTGVNMLKRQIDNKKGEVRLAVGQGFDAKATNTTEVALITFITKAYSNGQTSIHVGPESKIASAKVNDAILMKGVPLTVTIAK